MTMPVYRPPLCAFVLSLVLWYVILKLACGA
jgi:hypothetical protein